MLTVPYVLTKEENLSLLLTLTKAKTGASNEILSKIFYKLL